MTATSVSFVLSKHRLAVRRPKMNFMKSSFFYTNTTINERHYFVFFIACTWAQQRHSRTISRRRWNWLPSHVVWMIKYRFLFDWLANTIFCIIWTCALRQKFTWQCISSSLWGIFSGRNWHEKSYLQNY